MHSILPFSVSSRLAVCALRVTCAKYAHSRQQVQVGCPQDSEALLKTLYYRQTTDLVLLQPLSTLTAIKHQLLLQHHKMDLCLHF